MKRAAFFVGALAISACGPSPAPVSVPGPTVAHPANGATSTPVGATPVKAIGHLARRNAESGTVAFRIAFMGGSADDPAGKEGLTRLTATTMAEGGTEAHTYREIVDALFPTAAKIQVQVDRDETVFVADVAAASLEPFYAILKEVLLTPRLDAEGLDRLRERQRSELADDLRGSNDEELGKEALASVIYEGHPYGHPTMGTERGLALATVNDLRAQRSKVFCRERVLAGIEGGFPAGFEQRLVDDLDKLPTCTAPRKDLPTAGIDVDTDGHPKPPGLHVLVVDKPSADSTAISIGFTTPLTRTSDDFPAAAFAADYLGLHRQSAAKLYHELRERRGLNYGDYAYAEYFSQEGGGRVSKPNLARRQQMVSIWIRPVKPENAIFALRGALYFYKQQVSAGVPAAEIDRFRGFLTRYVALEQLTESRRLGYAMDDVTYGLKKPYLATMRDGWARLDETTLKAAMQKYMQPKDLFVAIVAKNGAALADALAKGDPSPPLYDAPKPEDVTTQDREIERYALSLTKDEVRVVKVGDLFK